MDVHTKDNKDIWLVDIFYKWDIFFSKDPVVQS